MLRHFVIHVLLLGFLLLAVWSCGGQAPTVVNGAQMPASAAFTGGFHDVSVCGRRESAPGAYRCSTAQMPQSRLSVCGDLAGDNTLSVAGQLQVGGNWTISSPATIAADAYVNGTVDARHDLNVVGFITASSVTGSGHVTASQVVTGPVTTPEPNPCTVAPVGVWVGDATTHPDITAALLHRDALANITEPTELTLGCGRYVVSSINAHNTLRIHLSGPTQLIVEGDVRVGSPMVIDSDDDDEGSLELIIGGSLEGGNTLRVGNSAHAAWVGVAGDVRVGSPMQIYGTLNATQGSVVADNTLDVWGDAQFGALRLGSPLRVHDAPTADLCLR